MALVWKVALVFLSVIGLSRAAECPPHWTFYLGSCYRFFGPEKTWQDAEDHCRGFFTTNGQGHLASIHQSSTNNFLIEMWKTSAQVAFDDDRVMWIGMTDQDEEGQFTWSDGTAFDFQDWHPAQPSNNNGEQHCGEIWYKVEEGQSRWNDRECSKDRPYVCKLTREY